MLFTGSSSMNRIFIDTETNWLPIRYDLEWDGSDNYPRIIQIAYLFEWDKVKKEWQTLIVPDQFEIKKEVSDLTWITQKQAVEKWIPLIWALLYLAKLINESDELICHNLDFDINVILSEFYRNKKYINKNLDFDIFEKIKNIKKTCTMKDQKVIDFVWIPWKYGNKFPKLIELHKKLFWEEFENQHEALSDIRATHRCYYELKKIWIIE